MVDETAEVEAYSPRFVPAEGILAPFEGDNPAGEELTYSGIYEQLKEAARADDPEVMGGDAFKPKGGWKVADWGEVAEICLDALRDKSKDFRVASYLARSLAEQHGLTGMRDGLWVMVEMQLRFWDHMHPLPDKIKDRAGNKILDPAPRSQDLKSVLDHYGAILAAMEVPDGDSLDDTRIVKVLRRVDGLETELGRIDAILEERYDGRGPSLSEVTGPLGKYAKVFRDAAKAREEAIKQAEEEEERRRQEEIERAAAAERQAEEDAKRRAAEAEARKDQLRALGMDPENPPIDPGGEPTGRADVLARLAFLSGWLHSSDPSDPAAYRVLLGAVWAGVMPGTVCPAPPAEAREALRKLYDEKAWDSLLDGCRAALVQEWGRDWIDPVFYIAGAIEAMGDAGARAMEDWKAEVRLRVARDPAFPTATFPDGTPLAGDEAAAWLASVLEEGAAGGGPGEGDVGLPPEEIERAEALFQAGSQAEAVELLHGVAAAGAGGRQRALMRLDLAEFCEEHGLGQVADPIYRDLASWIENRELEGWETQGFLARVYEGIYRRGTSGEEGSEQSQMMSQEAFEKLCLMDPGRALRNR